jgi:hypothetical protein
MRPAHGGIVFRFQWPTRSFFQGPPQPRQVLARSGRIGRRLSIGARSLQVNRTGC